MVSVHTSKYRANTIDIKVYSNSVEKHLYNPAHSPWLWTKLEPCHKGSRRCSRKQEVAWRRQLTHLPSPPTDLVPRTTTSNSLTSQEKRRNATSCARIANTWAIDPGHGLDMARGKGIQKAERMDSQRSWWSVRQNQRTCVHLQMHWARSMPLIKDNLILASLTFRRFSGWRWHIVLIVDTVLHAFASLRTCLSTSTKMEINCWALPRCWVL